MWSVGGSRRWTDITEPRVAAAGMTVPPFPALGARSRIRLRRRSKGLAADCTDTAEPIGSRHHRRGGVMIRRWLLVVSAGVLACAAYATPAHAGEGPTKDNVSNMGYCSAQLAQLPGSLGLAPTARAEVNKILKVAGPSFGVSSPGELYRVRAQTPKVEDDQCQRRTPPPPNGGTTP